MATRGEGDSNILTLRGDRISVLKIFKGGGDCLISYVLGYKHTFLCDKNSAATRQPRLKKFRDVLLEGTENRIHISLKEGAHQWKPNSVVSTLLAKNSNLTQFKRI